MMRRLPLLLFCLAATVLPVAAGETEVLLQRPSDAWVTYYATPLFAEVNSGGGDLHLSVDLDSWRIDRTFSVDDGGRKRFETFFPGRASGKFSWEMNGQSDQIYAHASGHRNENYDTDNRYIACVNGLLLRELEEYRNDNSIANVTMQNISSEDLPGLWQSYAGFACALILDASEADRLRPDQKTALARWVNWFGGRLWLVGENGPATADAMGLSAKEDRDRYGVRRREFSSGAVYFMSKPDPGACMDAVRQSEYRDLLRYYYNTRNSYRYRNDELFDDPERLSLGYVITCLVLLGLILGPVNYFYVKKKKSPLLFYVITPLAAGLGSLAIIGGSVLLEGGGNGKQVAALIRPAGGGEALFLDLRVVRSGFFTPTLRYPADTLLLPYVTGSDDKFTLDIGTGVVAGGDWLKPRFVTGYISARPVTSRMNLDLKREGDKWMVENNLGHAVQWVSVSIPDGPDLYAENIAPGDRAELRRNTARLSHESLCEDAGASLSIPLSPERVLLIAGVAGLPYQDDGGLGTAMDTVGCYYILGGKGAGDGR